MRLLHVTEAGSEHESLFLRSLPAADVDVTSLIREPDGSIPATGGAGIMVPAGLHADPRRLAWLTVQTLEERRCVGVVCQGRQIARALAGNPRMRGRIVLEVPAEDLDQYVDPRHRLATELLLDACALVVTDEGTADRLAGHGLVDENRLVIPTDDGWMWPMVNPSVRLGGLDVPPGAWRLLLALALAQVRTIHVASAASRAGELSAAHADHLTWRFQEDVLVFCSENQRTALHLFLRGTDDDEARPGRRAWPIKLFHQRWPVQACFIESPGLATYALGQEALAPLVLPLLADATPAETVQYDLARHVVVASSDARHDLVLRHPALAGRIVTLDNPPASRHVPGPGAPSCPHVPEMAALEVVAQRVGAISVRTSTKRNHVVVAGHDLKFAGPLIEDIARHESVDLDIDRWESQHYGDFSRSEQLLQDADTVWVEFASPMASWYSQRVKPTQRLIVRVHGYELNGAWAEGLDFARVHRVVFPSDHAARKGAEKWNLTGESAVVVPNSVDSWDLNRPKRAGSEYMLGLLGWTPALKRLDRAVELLQALIQHDDRFRLVVKGTPPSRQSWFWRDPTERSRFDGVFQALRRDAQLRDHVDFETFDTDIASWFEQVGWVLSPSVRETFHLAAVQGSASGSVPLVWAREGASDIFGDFVVPGTEAAASRVLGTLGMGQFPDMQARARGLGSQFDNAAIAPLWRSLVLDA